MDSAAFQECMRTLLHGEAGEQATLVFKLLDFHKKGVVSKSSYFELLWSLRGGLDGRNPQNKNLPGHVGGAGAQLFLTDQEGQEEELTQLQFRQRIFPSQALRLQIFALINSSFDFESRLLNFQAASFHQPPPPPPPLAPEEAKARPQASMEGKMFRMTGDGKLKAYYYRLYQQQLYVFKSQTASSFKSFSYLGHRSYIVPFVSRILHPRGGERIPGIELVSGCKRTKYYVIERDQHEQWVRSLSAGLGLSGVMEQEYKLREGVAISRKRQTAHEAAYYEKNSLNQQEYAVLKQELRKQWSEGAVEVFEDHQNVYAVHKEVKGSKLSAFYEKVATSIEQQLGLLLFEQKLFTRGFKREQMGQQLELEKEEGEVVRSEEIFQDQ